VGLQKRITKALIYNNINAFLFSIAGTGLAHFSYKLNIIILSAVQTTDKLAQTDKYCLNARLYFRCY
jgi:hypothetical protein